MGMNFKCSLKICDNFTKCLQLTVVYSYSFTVLLKTDIVKLSVTSITTLQYWFFRKVLSLWAFSLSKNSDSSGGLYLLTLMLEVFICLLHFWVSFITLINENWEKSNCLFFTTII